MSERELNPYQISIAENKPMGCFDIMLQIGGCRDRREAQAMADLLDEWVKGESKRSWSRKVQ